MYAKKDTIDILRAALQKLQKETPVTSIGPGSVARVLAEIVIDEIGDFYGVLDYNTSMGLLSTASGRALDMIGELYAVERKQLSEIAAIDKQLGSFYFYLDSPHTSSILIPKGTVVATNGTEFIGSTFTYRTTEDVTIPAGRLKAFASIRPEFNDSVFTAGANTITVHNFTAPEGVLLKATNPKPIAPQQGYESDENFRTRIRTEVRTSAGGTAEAIRFAGLAIEGVRDIKIRNMPYGLGSAELIVVSEDVRDAPVVLANVTDVVDRVAPVGVRVLIRQPSYVSCDVDASIVIKPNMNVDAAGTARRAEISVIRYLNTLLPGRPLVYSQLVQAMLDSSDVIADVQITRITVGGIEVPRKNHGVREHEQIVPSAIKVLTSS